MADNRTFKHAAKMYSVLVKLNSPLPLSYKERGEPQNAGLL
jgi:hypothetical protein